MWIVCKILQYFWPALSDDRSYKTNFGHLLLSGRLRQVLLYVHVLAPSLAACTVDHKAFRLDRLAQTANH